jgi:hypothetical protein
MCVCAAMKDMTGGKQMNWNLRIDTFPSIFVSSSMLHWWHEHEAKFFMKIVWENGAKLFNFILFDIFTLLLVEKQKHLKALFLKKYEEVLLWWKSDEKIRNSELKTKQNEF